MAFSIADYVGDDSTDTFAVPFPYLAQSHVEVYVSGVLKVAGTDYTWPNSGQITLNDPPATSLSVRIKRHTPMGTREVDFTNGSQIVEDDLDRSALQLLFLQQELWDYTTEVLANISVVVSGSGNVPAPLDPAEDNAVLVANAGTFSWQNSVSLSTVAASTLTCSGATSLTTLSVSGAAGVTGALTGSVATFSGLVTSGSVATVSATALTLVMQSSAGTAGIGFQRLTGGSPVIAVGTPRYDLSHATAGAELLVTVNNGTTTAPMFSFNLGGAGNAAQITTHVPIVPNVSATTDLGTAAKIYRNIYCRDIVVNGYLASQIFNVITDIQWNSSTGQLEVKKRGVRLPASAETAWDAVPALYVDV